MVSVSSPLSAVIHVTSESGIVDKKQHPALKLTERLVFR